MLANIGTIAVTNGGSGYVNQSPASPPTANTAGTFVDIVGGGGSGATAYATVAGGVVTSVTIFNAGSGYTSMPTIHISSTGVGSPAIAGSGATASVSGITLQSIALNDGGFDYTTPTISLSGGGGSGATASATPSSNITLNSNRGIQLTANGGTLYQTAGTTLTFGGVISSSGSGALNKSGAGTLILSGANTYTGNTVINSGVLQIGSTANLGSASNAIVFNGGTLRTSGGLTEARNVTLNAGGGTLDLPLPATFSGVFSGTGNLTKSGGGAMLILSNDNTYTGTTTISAGTLQVGDGGTTGSLASSAIANSTALAFNRSDNSSYAGVISGSGTLSKLGAGTLTLTGANTYTGATTVSAGALQIGNGGTSGSLANQGGIVNNGSVIFNRSDTSSYGGAISGSGSVTKLGIGTFTLGGSNSYAGDTNINGGVLQYNVTSNLGSNSNSIVFDGGTLRTLVAGSQARCNVTLNAGGGAIDTNGLNSTFSGNFGGTGALAKSGRRVRSLTGTNSYSGSTLVIAGRLTVSGASTALGTGNVTVLGTTANTALEIQTGVTNAIDDLATLSLFGGGTSGSADQGFADLGSGIIETVASLLLGGVAQVPGTYGSTTSGAMFQNDEYFAGTGIVAVPAVGDYNGDFKANAADYVNLAQERCLWRSQRIRNVAQNFEQSAAASPAPRRSVRSTRAHERRTLAARNRGDDDASPRALSTTRLRYQANDRA